MMSNRTSIRHPDIQPLPFNPLTPCADLVFGFSRPSYSFSESDGSASGLTVISTGANIGEFSIRIFAGTDDDNALATANGKICI